MNQLITINRMPVRTWERLRVNDAGLVLQGPEGVPAAEIADMSASGHITVKEDFDGLALGEDTAGLFIPVEMQAFIDRHATRRYFIRVPRNHQEKEPIRLTLYLNEKNPVLTDDVVIEAEEGSSATFILKYMSEKGAPVHHYGQTRVLVRRNAGVKLVKVQLLGGEAAHTDATGGVVEEGGRLDVILAELGAAHPLSSCNVVLEGEGGAAGLDVIYLGDGERSLDMTCRVEHRGRRTVSEIHGKGILLERSRKVFRDTLDFARGASGSRGREEESVLMLSPEARNISVPLLLCGESDVEGEHAASSGRPDDKVLFYLMSRGIDELEAKRLLAQAAFSSVVEKIPDASLREEILDTVHKSIERGG